jgi:hypothetical protein
MGIRPAATGLDWFFANKKQDTITDLSAGEKVNKSCPVASRHPEVEAPTARQAARRNAAGRLTAFFAAAAQVAGADSGPSRRAAFSAWARIPSARRGASD